MAARKTSDEIDFEFGELSETGTESDWKIIESTGEDAGLLKRRKRTFKIQYRRKEPYWLRSKDYSVSSSEDSDFDRELLKIDNVNVTVNQTARKINTKNIIDLQTDEELENSMLDLEH